MTWINNDMQHRKITKNSRIFQYYELLILAAQFVAWFKWSNPDIALAIRGARITGYLALFFHSSRFIQYRFRRACHPLSRSSSHAFDETAHHTKEIFDCFLAFHRNFQVGFPVLIIFGCYL